MTKRLSLFLAVLVALAALSACSTVSKEQFLALQSTVLQNQRKIGDLDKKLAEMEKATELSRKPQAELVSEMTTMRQELAALRGQSEENRYFLERLQGEDSMGQLTQELDKDKAATEERIKRLEAMLGIGPDGKKTAAAAQAEEKPKEAKPAELGAKELYNNALELYNKQKYEAAKAMWEQVVAKHPKDRYAPSSQFWVGQSYFAMKKYEEAILAYNQVIKRYPKHDKVAPSLLKQGLAFRALGDKRTAKIVLKKLVANYPDTEQARIAKKYLEQL